MPLKEFLHKNRGWLENGFWIFMFVFAYVAMQKVMHPGWTIFGI